MGDRGGMMRARVAAWTELPGGPGQIRM